MSWVFDWIFLRCTFCPIFECCSSDRVGEQKGGSQRSPRQTNGFFSLPNTAICCIISPSSLHLDAIGFHVLYPPSVHKAQLLGIAPYKGSVLPFAAFTKHAALPHNTSIQQVPQVSHSFFGAHFLSAHKTDTAICPAIISPARIIEPLRGRIMAVLCG